MDPDRLQSMADENGLEVTHYDGHSVVHAPDGPIVVAHPPGARVPARVGVPPMLLRTEAPASIATTPAQQRADALRAQAVGQRSSYEAEQGRIRAEQSLDESMSTRRAVDPQQTRHEPLSHADEMALAARERSQLADAARRELLRHTPTSAGTTTFPDGSTVTTDDRGASLPPATTAAQASEQMSRGGLRMPMPAEPFGAALDRPTYATTSAPQGSGYDPYAAPMSERGQMMSEQAAISPIMSMTPDQQAAAPMSMAPDQQAAAPVAQPRVARGGGRQQGAGVARGALDGVSLPPMASDGSIADLARDPRDGGQLDAPGRAYLVESQRAGLAERAAQTQGRIEGQAEQERRQLEQDRRVAAAAARGAYQNAINRVASEHLDPDRWYRDQGAGGVVSATIAVALGALGQAFTGSSTNSALDQINGAITRDIDAQRSDIEGGRAAASMQGNMVGIMRQEFTDRQAALDAAHAAMTQQVMRQLQQHEAQLQDQEARNNADTLRAQLAASAEEHQQAAIDRELHRRLTAAQVAHTEAQARHESRIAMGGGAARPHAVTAAQMDAYRQIVHNSPNIDTAQAAQLAGLPAGFVPEVATDPTNAVAVSALDGELTHLESIIPAEGDIPGVGMTGSLPDVAVSSEGRAVRRSASQVIELLGRLHSGGAISEDEQRRFTALVGAGAMNTDADLRSGIATVRRELGSRLRGRATDVAAPDHDISTLGGDARWVDQ